MSRGECLLQDRSIELAADIPLDTIDRKRLMDDARIFLNRYALRFSLARVHLHLKRENRRIACHVQLLTERGMYVSRVLAWEAQSAVNEAFENVDAQLRKAFERRASHTI